MASVFIVEDDLQIAEQLAQILLAEGYQIQMTQKLEVLRESILERTPPDVLLLDRLLGTADSKNSLQEIKRAWPKAKILILSAINTPLERAELLNLGADDYLGKPFLREELVARIRALSRRALHSDEYRKLGNTIIQLQRRTLLVGQNQTPLPAKEFLLLQVLSNDPGRVYRKEEILDRVWENNFGVESNVVESTVLSLRRKLDSIGSEISIKNLRNVGYWIES